MCHYDNQQDALCNTAVNRIHNEITTSATRFWYDLSFTLLPKQVKIKYGNNDNCVSRGDPSMLIGGKELLIILVQFSSCPSTLFSSVVKNYYMGSGSITVGESSSMRNSCHSGLDNYFSVSTMSMSSEDEPQIVEEPTPTKNKRHVAARKGSKNKKAKSSVTVKSESVKGAITQRLRTRTLGKIATPATTAEGSGREYGFTVNKDGEVVRATKGERALVKHGGVMKQDRTGTSKTKHDAHVSSKSL
ncbi:unnamed protein product [Arabis nemorensis]|uniref:Uncharacterized protein n=1 Tax=Arabis nemorensis TaxID=586526 RepID=A0A565CQ36_9BRAS|nr:unnamed protein product [Arabis nemorensis]